MRSAALWDGDGVRVLVVDDDKKLARAVKRGLEGEGFAVDVAFDGDEGLWHATENTYDALVLDVMLPGMSGLERLLVADDGPGVPPADRVRVFERFVRLDQARSRDAGGSGLGLSIAAAIARRHGGDVRVADADAGAAFEVWLPGIG